MFTNEVNLLGGNIAVINYGSVATGKVIASVYKIGVGYIKSRSDQLVDIDSCPGTNIDAGGINEENPAVSQQRSIDICRICREYPVEHRRTAAGLDKLYCFRLRNVKTAVINNCFIGSGYGCVAAALLD